MAFEYNQLSNLTSFLECMDELDRKAWLLEKAKELQFRKLLDAERHLLHSQLLSDE